LAWLGAILLGRSKPSSSKPYPTPAVLQPSFSSPCPRKSSWFGRAHLTVLRTQLTADVIVGDVDGASLPGVRQGVRVVWVDYLPNDGRVMQASSGAPGYQAGLPLLVRMRRWSHRDTLALVHACASAIDATFTFTQKRFVFSDWMNTWRQGLRCAGSSNRPLNV
jgi:hypothetical protein